MPLVTLTDITIRNLKPVPGKQVIYLDKALKGFGVRVTDKGAKSYVLTYGSDRRRVKLGDASLIKLAEARTEAKRILAEHTLGKKELPSVSVEDALTVFLTDVERRTRPRTARDYARLLRKHLAKVLKSPLDTIATRDLAHTLDRLADTPGEAAHALAAIRVFFNWCVRRSYLSQNPAGRLTATKRPARERFLNDQELRAVWRQAEAFSFPFGAIIRALILTGQRRSEIGLLEWTWINKADRTITLPAHVTKNGRTHAFPYGDRLAAILDSIPRTSQYVFPAKREHVKGSPVRTINGWSNSKREFDKLVPIPHWTLHDLRRTFATKLAAVGTPQPVTEKLLNHLLIETPSRPNRDMAGAEAILALSASLDFGLRSFQGIADLDV